MKKLSERIKRREHDKAVYAGEVEDNLVTFGTENPNGETEGDDGSAGGETTETTDYTKLTSHADLDAALEGREAPTGWKDMKVADKQAWLSDNPKAPAAGWGG